MNYDQKALEELRKVDHFPNHTPAMILGKAAIYALLHVADMIREATRRL